MTDTANPLTVADNFDVEVAHHDLLSTVDYLIKQLGYRLGQLSPDQIAMLRQSAERVHAAERRTLR